MEIKEDPVVISLVHTTMAMMHKDHVTDHIVGLMEIVIQEVVAAVAAVVVVVAMDFVEIVTMIDKWKFNETRSSFKIYQRILQRINFKMLSQVSDASKLMIDQVDPRFGFTKIE